MVPSVAVMAFIITCNQKYFTKVLKYLLAHVKVEIIRMHYNYVLTLLVYLYLVLDGVHISFLALQIAPGERLKKFFCFHGRQY